MKIRKFVVSALQFFRKTIKKSRRILLVCAENTKYFATYGESFLLSHSTIQEICSFHNLDHIDTVVKSQITIPTSTTICLRDVSRVSRESSTNLFPPKLYQSFSDEILIYHSFSLSFNCSQCWRDRQTLIMFDLWGQLWLKSYAQLTCSFHGICYKPCVFSPRHWRWLTAFDLRCPPLFVILLILFTSCSWKQRACELLWQTAYADLLIYVHCIPYFSDNIH